MSSSTAIWLNLGMSSISTSRHRWRWGTTADRRCAPGGEAASCCSGRSPATWDRRVRPSTAESRRSPGSSPKVGDPYLDIAPVALFLAGEGCRYLTGNTLFVDGGSHINGVAWTPDLDAAP
jgi:NAD(P)-dependent dehydrogenase (short-subunit alcohol dehydrogenase family)